MKLGPFIVLAVAILTFLRNLGSFPLRNWDEAWYAEIIKNMATGQYGFLVSFWNGQYYFDKPPLYFWLSLPFFKIFGPPAGGGEWQARIVSAIAAIFATLFVYLLAKRFFNFRTAVLSALIFLTLGQVVVRFAHGNLDALAVCLCLATVYFYVVLKKVSWPVAGLFLGLTYLSKGWILGFFPILTIFLLEYFLLGRNFKKFLAVVGFSLVMVSPYYILGYINFGEEFINWFLFNPTASLFSPGNFSFEFFANLVRDIGFWFVPFVLGIALGLVAGGKDRVKLIVLVTVSFSFLIGISFLSGKLGWYALPAYPFVAILLAYFVGKVFDKKFVLATALVIVVAVLQVYNVIRIENIYPDRSRVGAELGKVAAEIVPAEDVLILDDHDFPTFLYYSNHKTVFELSDTEPLFWQWWVFKYEDLPKLLSTSSKVWIVTRDSSIYPGFDVSTEVEGYKFLKIIDN